MIKNDIDRLTKSEFSNKITVISFLLSYLIIQQHAYNVAVYDLGNELLDKIVIGIEVSVLNISRIGVPLFFIISGYLFFKNFEIKNTFTKWKSRIRTLVVPWILWGVLYWLYYLVIKYATNGRLFPHKTFTLDSFCKTVFAHENTIFWYLQATIFFVILAPIFYYALKNHKKIYNGIVVLIIVLFLCTIDVIPAEITMFGEEYINYLPIRLFNICYYMLGAYIGINHKDIVFIKNKKLTLLGIVGLVVCFVIMHIVEAKNMNGFLLSAFCVSFWYALDVFRFDKQLPWYMKISFFIYCAHIAILNVIEKVILMLGGSESAVWALIDFIIAPILTMPIIILAAYIIRRFIPRLWSILNGGRG